MMLQATPNPAVVRELEEVERQIMAAWERRDCAAWGAFLADDWAVTHIDAQIITKAQALEMCRSGPAISSALDQLIVRSYGDMAVVTGRTTASTSDADPITVKLRFTDVFVKRDGRWLVVASHATRIPE
jgi:ketosteroid isomerase-like protein